MATEAPQDSVRLDYPEFAFSLPDGGNTQWVRTIYDSLLSNYQRITGHLHVSTMPRMRVSIWAHDAGFFDAMRRDLGQAYAGAAGGESGYVNLIRSNGSVQPILGVTESQFGTMIERCIGRQ
jgi:hypothetical protein